jgi:2'-5' RNA ligase
MSEASNAADALPERVRAFLSIGVPEAIARGLDRVKRRLEEALPGDLVRWTPTGQIHLTLRFLGDIPASALPELETTLRHAATTAGPLDLEAEGLGCFPNARQPRVLWVGLRGDLEALQRLQARLDAATGAWAEKAESRSFHPHLTLGRVRDGAFRQARQVGEALGSVAVPLLGRWRAEQFHLLRSQLSPQGARHTVLASFALAGPSGQPDAGPPADAPWA